MQATDIQTQARMLQEAHGDKALLEAHRKVKACELSGDTSGALDWRPIESALKLMQGPRASGALSKKKDDPGPRRFIGFRGTGAAASVPA